jgi:hypothetical protein
MNTAELILIKEGLQLADDALARLMEVDNEHVKHIANMLHSAVWFGEMVLNVKGK